MQDFLGPPGCSGAEPISRVGVGSSSDLHSVFDNRTTKPAYCPNRHTIRIVSSFGAEGIHPDPAPGIPPNRDTLDALLDSNCGLRFIACVADLGPGSRDQDAESWTQEARPHADPGERRMGVLLVGGQAQAQDTFRRSGRTTE